MTTTPETNFNEKSFPLYAVTDKLIVSRAKPKTHHGSIEIPETERRERRYGIVQAVGPDVRTVRVGHVVTFAPGVPVKVAEIEAFDLISFPEDAVAAAATSIDEFLSLQEFDTSADGAEPLRTARSGA